MRILVGYDDSPPAKAAIHDLKRAGMPKKAEARVVMVIRPWIPPDPTQALSDSPGWFNGAFREALADAKEAEAEAENIAGIGRDALLSDFPQWKVNVAATIASPANGLLDMGHAWKPDLILVGSHSRSALGRMFLGSVAQKVLAHAGCAVRIGRASRRKGSTPPRLLIGIDGSPDSMANVKSIAKRTWPQGAEARILTIMDFALSAKEAVSETVTGKTGGGSGTIGWPWIEGLHDLARKILEHGGLKVSTRIIQGKSPKLLIEEAKRFKADNLFLGSRGLTGMGRFYLGSVSSAVAMGAPCSVEVHRKKIWEGKPDERR